MKEPSLLDSAILFIYGCSIILNESTVSDWYTGLSSGRTLTWTAEELWEMALRVNGLRKKGLSAEEVKEALR